jgi:hypothetical protein
MAVMTVEIASEVAISFAHSKQDTNAISSRRRRRMHIGKSCLRSKPRNQRTQFTPLEFVGQQPGKLGTH